MATYYHRDDDYPASEDTTEDIYQICNLAHVNGKSENVNLLCIYCNGLTRENKKYTVICKRCNSRAHGSSGTICTSYVQASDKDSICDRCLLCTVCEKVTRLDDRLSSQSMDKPKKIDTYICKKCRKCIVCKRLTNEDGSQTAFCSGKNSSGKKCTNLTHANKQTNCTILKKKTVQGFKCTDCKKK